MGWGTPTNRNGHLLCFVRFHLLSLWRTGRRGLAWKFRVASTPAALAFNGYMPTAVPIRHQGQWVARLHREEL